jgi:hypothetical protein
MFVAGAGFGAAILFVRVMNNKPSSLMMYQPGNI